MKVRLTNEVKAQNMGITNIIYHYDRVFDPGRYPGGVITSCLLLKGRQVIARGTVLCNPYENFVKKAMRPMALGRAVQALCREENSGMFIFHGDHIGPEHSTIIAAANLYLHRSAYMPSLTEKEQNIINHIPNVVSK